MFIAGVSGEPDRWLKLMLLRLATLLRLFSCSLLSPSVFICRWPLALLLQPLAIPKFPSSPRQPKATLFPPIWPPSGPQETCSARQVQGSSPLWLVSNVSCQPCCHPVTFAESGPSTEASAFSEVLGSTDCKRSSKYSY